MTVAALQIPLPTTPVSHGPGPGLSDAAAVIMVLAILSTALVLMWPLMRALARRLDGGVSKDLQLEVDVLRSRLQQLEDGQARMAELEERLDFAERMLAQSREPDRLPR